MIIKNPFHSVLMHWFTLKQLYTETKLKQGNLTPLIPEEEEFQLENHLFNVLDLSLIVDCNDVSVVVE